MAVKSLAVKYRPQTFDDVTEQSSVRTILQQQLQGNEVKNAYLFCGGAGTGKTTCARIFANEINKGQGNPIEMDAASHSGVDDVRGIIQQAKTKSLDSEYKVFIIDECHSISNTGWQAFLKLIEEPPAKSIFIFCTTDPQKIPKTILSRVQRYDFHRISQRGIVERLNYICNEECITIPTIAVDSDYAHALEYIAKIADGGMRDAITMLDKCLAYSKELTLDNVVTALGVADYDTMMDLTDCLIKLDAAGVIQIIEELHSAGKDLKQFVRQYMQFILDVNKYILRVPWEYMNIPRLEPYEKWLDMLHEDNIDYMNSLLSTLVNLNSEIKYSPSPKYDIEARLMGGSYT